MADVNVPETGNDLPSYEEVVEATAQPEQTREGASPEEDLDWDEAEEAEEEAAEADSLVEPQALQESELHWQVKQQEFLRREAARQTRAKKNFWAAFQSSSDEEDESYAPDREEERRTTMTAFGSSSMGRGGRTRCGRCSTAFCATHPRQHS
ncbi:unnamed protein product [Effrenium voratum]|nr:unnamed protein product [Effrenium voratum]